MKWLFQLVFLAFLAHVGFAQGNPSPYLVSTLVSGVLTPAPASSQLVSGGNPPPLLCETLNSSGQLAYCSFSGSGSGVTSVSGTVNQIDVASGTTTPVISFDANALSSLGGFPLVGGALTGATGGSPASGGINATQVEVNGVNAATLPFPTNMRLMIEGASQDIQYNTQGEVYVSASTPGSAYTGTTGTIYAGSISGLTCVTPPTVNGELTPSGTIQSVLTYFGQECSGTGTVTYSGTSGGSGAGATLSIYSTYNSGNYPVPWGLKLQSLSVLNGKIASTTNYAVSGTTVANAITRFGTNGYAALCGSATYAEYFLIGGDLGQNSIVAGGETAAQAYTDWITFVHMLKNAGCKVIVTTAMQRDTITAGTTTFAQMASITAFDQLMRQGIQGIDYDYGIDFGGEMGCTFDNGAFSYDTLHFTGTGAVVAATVANKALAAGGTFSLAPSPNGVCGWFPGSIYSNGTINANTGLAVSGNISAQANEMVMAYAASVSTITAGSSTTTPGGFKIYGGTSTPTSQLYATWAANGTGGGTLTEAGNITASLGFTTSGAPNINASTAQLGWFNNSAYLYGGSNASTPGNVTITGTNSSGAQTAYGVFSTPGNLALAGLLTSGNVKFTTSGCSVSSTTGNGTVGEFTLGANTCNVVVTLNGATGLTAAHGWHCTANDETTVAGNTGLYWSANSATTATLTVPATAGTTDVIDFGCQPF